MKNILLLVHDDEGQEARLQAALDLTRALGGHLICLDVVALPMLAGDPQAAAGITMLLEHEREQESRHCRRMRERLAHEDVSWTLESAVGGISDCLTQAAAMADIVIVDRAEHGNIWGLAGDLIARSGKPVIAVGKEEHSFNPCGCAIVAWNGSSASIAALQAATPLLRLSGSVILLEIQDGSVQIPAREAAAYLSRHGVHALIRFEQPRGRKVADILLEEVHDRGADYLVMGGFDHSRLTETLLGGVTRTLLSQCPVPLVLMRG